MTGLSGAFPGRHMPDEASGPTVLGWDGRIDNAHDLRLQLKDRLRGNSSAVGLVTAAFARWGVPGLGRIVGDWSVVIHDPASRRVVLASDYAGIRPLYYHEQGGRVHWSSSLESIVKTLRLDAIDETYIAGFLMLGGCPHRTPYADVRSVPSGHAVCVSPTGVTTHSFWALPAANSISYKDERRYDEQFVALFREAVAVRLQTSAPVVAELSGGLDSSSVVCMANELIRTGVVPAPALIPMSYVYRQSIDTPFIQEVETWCDVRGIHLSTHEMPLASEADAANATPGGSAPLERAAATAAQGLGAKVFLTGQNGDLATGNWFDDSLQVAAPLRRGRLGQTWTEALAWSRLTRVPVWWILGRAAQALVGAHGASSALYSIEGAASVGAETSVIPQFLSGRHGAESRHLFSQDWMAAPVDRRRHFRALTLLRELRTLQALEPMRGLDYTHPFAHRPLVEFLFSVSSDVLCRPGEPRRLMRRALADLWPPRLRARRSKGLLGAPQFEALKPLAARLIAERRWQVADRGWVNGAAFVARLEKLKNGIDCNVPQLRQIILLEYWLRNRETTRPQTGVLRAADVA
jgi:asparagine synthase (glutamine-hydrolysing)